jgi:hypothetical protein
MTELKTPHAAEPASNPANGRTTKVTSANRIPMSVPVLRLETNPIPGYHQHWFLGTNVPRARKGGYEFVTEEETEVVNSGIGNDREEGGNTDLGSRVSRFAGGLVEGTSEPQRLYLMKIRNEWWEADQRSLADVNEGIARTLRGGNAPASNGASAPDETPDDRTKKYLKKGQDLFFPKQSR